MKIQLIQNVRIVFPGERIATGSLLLKDGRIEAVNPPSSPAGVEVVDGHGGLLTPGLIDLHTHGIGHFLYETSGEALLQAAATLPRHGTTCVFPTLYSSFTRDKLDHLRALTEALEKAEGIVIPGFHMEGPFLALPGAGAQTIPGDLGLLDELLEASRHRVGAMSVSPDTPGILPVIERLRELGIVPFMTHTRASAEQTQAAMDAGARHATHFYDVFPVPPETEPGVRAVGAVEAILANRRVSVDFIADGVHVHPMAIRAALAAKGWDGVILITDSNIGAGLPPGEYDTPWGFRVRVAEGRGARNANNDGLAGSALTMDAGIRNLLQWLDLPPEQVWAMGTLNPARLMGLDRKGRIAPGADADLVLWDEPLRPLATWVGGRLVFQRKKQEDGSLNLEI